ncbi:stage III sporulation protein AF [Oceanobacillus piezotolerans]|uniref:stage III sporulation protein AF n=1 Tax=Oceanobacillus piezotolerans TaxID=2448030 RepID=UPI001FEC6DE3|nr:stage III sporulation protein AF [Oceanobacillus piezotolerans]
MIILELIIQWVTQIIIFVILATILDLIIPSSAMKKYIQLVVGLILILILLNPIFYILNIDIDRALNSSFQQLNQIKSTEGSVENLIELQKKEIQTTQDAYILEQMAVPLIDLAKEPLIEGHNLEITNLDFQFSTNQQFTYEDLQEVIVTVKNYEKGEGEMGVVEDVVINTNEPIENEDRHEDEVKSLLTELWGLEDKEITIYWEGGSS